MKQKSLVVFFWRQAGVGPIYRAKMSSLMVSTHKGKLHPKTIPLCLKPSSSRLSVSHSPTLSIRKHQWERKKPATTPSFKRTTQCWIFREEHTPREIKCSLELIKDRDSTKSFTTHYHGLVAINSSGFDCRLYEAFSKSTGMWGSNKPCLECPVLLTSAPGLSVRRWDSAIHTTADEQDPAQQGRAPGKRQYFPKVLINSINTFSISKPALSPLLQQPLKCFPLSFSTALHQPC